MLTFKFLVYDCPCFFVYNLVLRSYGASGFSWIHYGIIKNSYLCILGHDWGLFTHSHMSHTYWSTLHYRIAPLLPCVSCQHLKYCIGQGYRSEIAICAMMYGIMWWGESSFCVKPAYSCSWQQTHISTEGLAGTWHWLHEHHSVLCNLSSGSSSGSLLSSAPTSTQAATRSSFRRARFSSISSAV